MSEAQRRRELADKLARQAGPDFNAAWDVITLLRSDATALEALVVEPVATVRVQRFDFKGNPFIWFGHLKEGHGLADGEKLYGPDTAGRLVKALAQRDALAEALSACLQYGSMTGDAWVEEKATAALKEIGHVE